MGAGLENLKFVEDEVFAQTRKRGDIGGDFQVPQAAQEEVLLSKNG